jgi:ferritin
MEPVIIRKSQKNPFATQTVIDALNYRIEQEEYSSRIYHAMSMWLNDNGYMGAAKAWQSDSDDEMKHATWAKEYLLDMGIQPKIPALKEPPQTFTGLPDVIRQSYTHEIDITNQCNALANKALSTSDNLLYQLANKFLQEQQEELGKLQTLLDKLEAFGEDKIAIRLLDNELGG